MLCVETVIQTNLSKRGLSAFKVRFAWNEIRLLKANHLVGGFAHNLCWIVPTLFCDYTYTVLYARSDWPRGVFAWEYVNMVVAGKMFCFSRANHASTNLKKVSSSKLHKFTLFTHSFVGWNLENRYKEGVSIFLCLSWHFKREKSVFWKVSFCKTRTDYACKTLWTRIATGKNFSFNQSHTKSFAFFLGKVIL